MTTEAFQRNLAQLAVSARQCLDKDQALSALVLIYSQIDIVAWAAAARTNTSTRTRFEDWLKRFVYPINPLPCTPTELYAARCGILHTLTAEADLLKRSDLRRIAYAWGKARVETFEVVSKMIEAEKIVGLHLDDLLNAVFEGVNNMLLEAHNDAILRLNLDDAAGRHFGHLPRSVLESLEAEMKK